MTTAPTSRVSRGLISLPDGGEWITTQKASGGGHWTVTEHPPNITANPSVWHNSPTGWHGWVRQNLRHEAGSPRPAPLRYLVNRLQYRDGYRISLHDDYDRGQGSIGLTLIINITGKNSYPPHDRVSVNHLFPVHEPPTITGPGSGGYSTGSATWTCTSAASGS